MSDDRTRAGWKAIGALLLTLVFYWYDRNSMS